MSGRRSIEVEGFRHGAQPIPAASRVGPLVVTGSIFGLDRELGAIPDDAAEQVRLVFDNLAAIMTAAGGSLDSVAKLSFQVRESGIRPLVNDAWLGVFPDAAARPARHVTANSDLAANILVQCEAIAWITA